MATKQATAAPTRSHLSLKGSSAIVHEFFSYSLQSILYQRELYPSEEFKTVKKYGMQILVATDEELQEYLTRSMAQVQEWLQNGAIERLVVAIVEKGTGEVRERWQFDVQVTGTGTDEDTAAQGKENAKWVERWTLPFCVGTEVAFPQPEYSLGTRQISQISRQAKDRRGCAGGNRRHHQANHSQLHLSPLIGRRV